MSAMDNRDEVLQVLERFTRLKQKDIPRELEDYLSFVARTGDTVYPWPTVKYFFRTKLSYVIMDFHDNTPSISELPQCPNVDPFCYDRMKRTLLSRMDSFNSAPFTIQRICELLNEPRKHYTRIDKFMRAVEKNILVVSTQEPGRRRSDSENGDSLDSIVNGDLEVNVDIEMDNDTFGIDSNEIVTNAAAAAITNAVLPAVTNAAQAEETPPSESPEEDEQELGNQKLDPVSDVASVNNDVKVEEDNLASLSEDGVPKESIKDTNGKEENSSEITDGTLGSNKTEVTLAENFESTPKEEQISNVVDSVEPDILEEKKHCEIQAQKSPDTTESTETEQPAYANATDTNNESLDDDEPKAKMAKLSQVDSASENPDQQLTSVQTEKAPIDHEKETVSSESTTDSTGSAVEYAVNNNSPEPGPALTTSDESTIVTNSISSQEYSDTDPIVPSSNSETSLTHSSAVAALDNLLLPNDESKLADSPDESEILERSAVTSDDSAAPSDPAVYEIEGKCEEKIIQRVNLQVGEPLDDVPPLPSSERVNPNDMETHSAVIPENVMATDEEEQPRSDAVDGVIPMAADSSSKSDENAMDIDESSVEPMDQ